MNNISIFLVSFCTTLVAIGGYYLLCPEGKFAKFVKYILILVIILSTITFISKIKNLDFDFDFNDNFTLNEDITAENIKMIFETALKNENISYEKIEIITDKNESGSIIISKIIIYSNDTYEKITSVIGESNDYEVQIINE